MMLAQCSLQPTTAKLTKFGETANLHHGHFGQPFEFDFQGSSSVLQIAGAVLLSERLRSCSHFHDLGAIKPFAKVFARRMLLTMNG